ncbi:MAG: hypothetical protein EAZ90_11860 [Oscillatoriales cyanobacterium]|nr:MAG: hypothetical protein EAZ90_11860 [Oscillatoriales cyanobacterium]
MVSKPIKRSSKYLDKACLFTFNGSEHSNPSDSNATIASYKPESVTIYQTQYYCQLDRDNVNSRSRAQFRCDWD